MAFPLTVFYLVCLVLVISIAFVWIEGSKEATSRKTIVEAIEYPRGGPSEMTREEAIEWTKGLPIKPGDYWFYGYRYGKERNFSKIAKPEFLRMTVRLDANNNPMRISEGSFLYASEVEEPWYMPLEYPEPPNTKEARP